MSFLFLDCRFHSLDLGRRWPSASLQRSAVGQGRLDQCENPVTEEDLHNVCQRGCSIEWAGHEGEIAQGAALEINGIFFS